MRHRLVVAALALFVGTVACSEDSTPDVAVEIDVRRDAFFPATNVFVKPGSRVRWVNVVEPVEGARTVTSGTGPEDPAAGVLFDVILQPRESGEAVGDEFVYRFNDPGNYPYFSRLPQGEEYSGWVIVQ
jgi:plastocyanin